MPPYLAGRDEETQGFRRLIAQKTILDNMVLTGLRGVGKTVLLEKFKPIAIEAKWRWVGTELSESASVSEETLARRLLTDLDPITSDMTLETHEVRQIGYTAKTEHVPVRMGFNTLVGLYEQTPGLVSDKLKHVLEVVWGKLAEQNARGLIFAYDEAQNMFDRPEKEQYPLALLLDVFQSIQRKGIPFMLVLTGLPTLFPKLVDARTFAERMFSVVVLKRLTEPASRDAITKPIEDANCRVRLNDGMIDEIIEASSGYPYFIQFFCREVYDVVLQMLDDGEILVVPIAGIIRKLDTNFFAGRWAKATDRQRELLSVIAALDNCDDEFTVQAIVEKSKERSTKSFGASHVNQMLSALGNSGLIYKNRHGRYSFAVPLFGAFILRQEAESAAND